MKTPTMRKAHYVAIAATIHDLTPFMENARDQEITANRFAAMLAQTNPLFDRAKFLKACGVVP